MQNITDRLDSKRGVEKAIQRRKHWFTGPLEETDQTSTLAARKLDFSNRLTVVNQLAADYAKEPCETKKVRRWEQGLVVIHRQSKVLFHHVRQDA